MATYHHLYTNDPTAGGTDGTMVSEGRLFTSPIIATLNASESETKYIKCAIRCDSNYYSVGEASLTLGSWNGGSYSPGGGNTGKFALCKDKSTAGSITYTLSAVPSVGDQGKFGDVTLKAGTDFAIGSSVDENASNITTAINAKSQYYNATVSGAIITVSEKFPGSGHTPAGFSYSENYIKCTFSTPVTSVAADENTMKAATDWADTLTYTEPITDKNVVFWIRVQATTDEAPQRDESVGVLSYMTIAASA
jgi:hypothetical protein